jgi:SpoVK/Ycf46/Vps4 family AAA+-type ATPase
MARSRQRIVTGIPAAYSRLLQLWILRVLIPLGGLKALASEFHCMGSEVLKSVGIDLRLPRREEPDLPALLKRLKEKLQKAEADLPGLPSGTPMAKNIDWLGDLVGLNEVERGILHFVILQAYSPGLSKVLEGLGSLNLAALQRLFSVTLGYPAGRVRKAMDSTGALSRTGLLSFDLDRRYVFEHKVELLPGMGDRFSVLHNDPFRLFADHFTAASAGTLGPQDFTHLQADLDILEPFLEESLRTRRKGVNILIYGPPGSGKSELARVLARNLGGSLYEVAAENQKREPLQGPIRFRAYRLSQSILEGRPRHLILFDEIEDVFKEDFDPLGIRGGNLGGMKAWVNRMLEENNVPAFWITNHVGMLDRAFIRRFDFALKVDIPPRSVRMRILENCVEGLPISTASKQALAEHEHLAPAVIARASKVAKTLRSRDRKADTGAALVRTIENTLQALGAAPVPPNAAAATTEYRPDLLNTDADLPALQQSLQRSREGRLCFYGPPGTGKTAFGRHLAEQIDRPLLVKRASDLLSMWVGGTEQNIAKMFREAALEHAVLLLDEADSFLQDRSGAQRSWELTQVNEMLTQMEAFQGVFIASTNLMDSLDSAALRRFDLKIRFGYLKSCQAWEMFGDTVRRLGLEPDETVRATLERLTLLTPGDFATIMRQTRLGAITTARDLALRLGAECAAKPEGKRKAMGF